MPTIEKIEKRKRGFFGTILWILFLLFNGFMALWLFFAISSSSERVSELASEAEKAGAVIGTGLAATMILWIWLFGAIILGLLVLLSRGKKITIERQID